MATASRDTKVKQATVFARRPVYVASRNYRLNSFDYDATEYYQSYEDLFFLLKHTPLVGGKIENGETGMDASLSKSFFLND
ncbi:hypothetical protein [Candidatus Pristimantibacillus sp. PTI5]|uniref:hypothetical protein n=1 Tax=Candidatus Pristimantibacillus sp. PTI5 TaxID=3400422 RepID=UPI003B01BF58